ncbi:MAG TPA: aspartate aminotransferase family protein [Bryobacteraceae bacterium]|jgi:ornithine--oxo-acid transaminase|nr:aspartate aminotransferase family protein [Bryobacteraceae bacterium]
MNSDFLQWIDRQQGRQYELHTRHINPVFVKMLRTIGFDKGYVRGEGSYLYDEHGTRYLDFLTGWGVFALGRNHPKVRSILEQVLSREMPNLVRMECSLLAGLVAEKLTGYTGSKHSGLSRVFFTNSGTESVETAIKFARCATGKQKILYCDNAFHGLTVGALSLNGAGFFRERFGDLMPGTEPVEFNDLASLERALHRRDVAAFVIEAVQGKSCKVVADGYLAEAQRLCRKAGALLVMDEVQCGLGRTGKWFAYQHWPEVEPDVVCVAKALSGGYVPVGAVITTPKIMDTVFDSMERCVVHSNTFGQNDLAMAAALATLQVMEEERVVENAAALGEYAMRSLANMGLGCPFVDEVRGKGLMFGIDFKRPENSLKLKAAWDTLHTLNFGVFSQMITVPLLQEHRILTQVAGYHTDVIKLLPPLNVTRAEIDWFLGAMQIVLEDIQRVPGAAWNTMTAMAKGVMRAQMEAPARAMSARSTALSD